ncbi:LysR substrate-binding domain-containing protein [Mesoterricola sediminis]|uniref:LysR family transcriptional regulator n=1 Tax=Mesoterricola sediminis TaxID=2927980 RepID=A0AA48GV49_9BACT|nr:LysR substrate-binding domain-containing protein [Mesoterricola sediminis]BDU78369.1 LysR family transcriptional regulator [Mesoterricola sediminis]
MELRLLRYFAAVAEELNVTRAAERLHTAQPNLSQQVRRLEELVGAPLFHRDKHRLQLSEAGRALLPAAKAILASVDMALEQARAAARREVSRIVLGIIPGPEGMVLSRIAPLIKGQSPGAHLIVRTMTGPEIVQALLRREITAGFLRGPIDHAELTGGLFMHEEVRVVLPEAWDLARLPRIPVKALAGLPHIPISPAVAPAVHQVALDIQARAGVTFTESFCSENVLTSLNAVSAGLGFCFFANYVEDIVPKGVVTRPLDLDPAPTLDLIFARRRDDHSPALAILEELVETQA